MRSPGEILRLARRRRGFPRQEDLAERLGVTQQAVSDWETNTERPSVEHMDALEDLLGIDPSVFAMQPSRDELLEVLTRVAVAVEDCARALRGELG
jgi:transcriptional regulator with XRE-family HTH domain